METFLFSSQNLLDELGRGARVSTLAYVPIGIHKIQAISILSHSYATQRNDCFLQFSYILDDLMECFWSYRNIDIFPLIDDINTNNFDNFSSSSLYGSCRGPEHLCRPPFVTAKLIYFVHFFFSFHSIAMVVRFITRRYIGEYDPNLEKVYTHTTAMDNETVMFEILDAAGPLDVIIFFLALF